MENEKSRGIVVLGGGNKGDWLKLMSLNEEVPRGNSCTKSFTIAPRSRQDFGTFFLSFLGKNSLLTMLY